MKRFAVLLALILTPAIFFAGQASPPQNKVYLTATAPVNGTNAIQTITFGGTPTGGTFILKFNNRPTGSISWNSTNATLVANIDTALEALNTIGSGGVTTAVGTMTAGIGTITVTFSGQNAKMPVNVMTYTSSLTGSSPTLAIATSTPGITADGRISAQGNLCVAADTGYLYVNTSSTALNPTWTAIAHP